MLETVRDVLIHTTEESMAILLSLSSILFVFLVIYWQYNRRRFQKLSHQIPAGVVKDYLDSVIQNSSAIKSSLFLGDGGRSSGPTVVPIEKLSQTHAGEGGLEELSRKNAEIAELRDGLSIKDKIITELESQLANIGQGKNAPSSKETEVLRGTVEQLKKELQEKRSGVSMSEEELNKLLQERDALRDSLKEYEIIEDDLANLKSLQEENVNLREMVKKMGGSLPKKVPGEQVPEVPEVPETPKPDENIAKKEDNERKNNGDDDSEELLKEFEKMLG